MGGRLRRDEVGVGCSLVKAELRWMMGNIGERGEGGIGVLSV